jgi:DNA-binding response OmpR family regulator
MARVLLVDDSYDCQLLVKRALEDSVDLVVAPTLEKAKSLLQSQDFDLLLLDVNLPDGDGFGFCSSLLFEKGNHRPRVLFLTGKTEMADKLTGFSVGGDDYLVKPFEPLELRARVQAHVRNIRETILAARTVQIGNMRMDLSSHSVDLATRAGKVPIDFTPTEFKLLHYLAKQEGQISSRGQLLAALFDGKVHVVDRTIDAHLSRVRKKLMECTHTIEPVYGVGYRFAKKAA